jgi:hypothetical protein
MNPLEERPLLSFGHDECIFRQFIFTGRSWRGASGEQAIIPKHEGYELMVSAFQSRELGFGFELTAEQLNVVNSFCQSIRPHYLETESALKAQSKTEKSNMVESPFIKYFKYGYGEGKEGYWTYNHMALQFEDCVDVIQALFPGYDSVWTFGHSCGHNRGCPDGLVVGNMQTLWGGKQSHIRDSITECKEGFLGPYSPKLHPGDTQTMVFSEDDEGPFYLPLLLESQRE